MTLKKRFERKFNQVHGFSKTNLFFTENNTKEALLTIFPDGTKPAPPFITDTRLSEELSRLSPITK